jgi:predicted ATPase
LTPLIGREAEIAEIKDRLTGHRLVTLTGAGGVGKTRLAIEAGRSLLGRYPDGVWIAELAPLNDTQLVTSSIGEVLGVTLTAPAATTAALVAALKGKQLLLIIDNCEHVIGEAAQVAVALKLVHAYRFWPRVESAWLLLAKSSFACPPCPRRRRMLR